MATRETKLVITLAVRKLPKIDFFFAHKLKFFSKSLGNFLKASFILST